MLTNVSKHRSEKFVTLLRKSKSHAIKKEQHCSGYKTFQSVRERLFKHDLRTNTLDMIRTEKSNLSES